jgi:RNA-directed DNA polymerase
VVGWIDGRTPAEKVQAWSGETGVDPETGRKTAPAGGAPLSPLLANLYMRRFILGWKKQGWEQRFEARVVNYADDFVILCRQKAMEARDQMQKLMSQLKLTVNEKKTKVCRVPAESFDFLGYTIGQQHSARGGKPYIGTRPSRKRIQRFCEAISLMTARTTLNAPTETLIYDLNLKLKGWANYFCLGAVSKAYRAVDSHVRFRLRQWLRRKHKKSGAGTKAYSDEHLYERLGLVRLELRTKLLPWAKAAHT